MPCSQALQTLALFVGLTPLSPFRTFLPDPQTDGW